MVKKPPAKRPTKKPPVRNPSARKPAKSALRAAATDAPKPAAKPATRPAVKSMTKAVPADLTVGSRAPAFRLPRDGGGSVALADFAGHQLAIFFYPRADTPGCTREAIAFSHLAAAFTACDTALLGVSADPPQAQEAFRDKHGLSVPLGSDPTHAMLGRYQVWGEKKLYGKVFEGIIRTTVLIDRSGRIAQVWRNVKVDGHADAVLAAAQALARGG